MVFLAAGLLAQAQTSQVSYDPAAKAFRLDGGGVSYVFGVNPRGELQQLYWGGTAEGHRQLSAGRAAAGMGLV